MKTSKIILGLVPFAVFGVLGPVIPVGAAALIAGGIALILLLVDLRGGVKPILVAGVLILAMFSLIGFVGGADIGRFEGSYARALATLALALFIFVTLPFAPFTAAYAKETVPEQYWKSERFLSENRRISAAWGGSVLAMAVGHFIADSIATPDTPRLLLAILNWGLPIAAILLTVRYTKSVVGATANTSTAA